jgi:hypothetical protein
MPRRTTRSPERQLPLDWTDAMRWTQLPAEVRTQLVTELRALLEQAARRAPAGRSADDE